MSDLWTRLRQESREKVEEWNQICALLHGARARDLLRLRCVGGREVRETYGLVLRLQVRGMKVVMGFSRTPFAPKLDALSNPWILQELSESLRVMVVGEVLREIVGEGDIVVEGVDFIVGRELRVRIPLEVCRDGEMMEVDIWMENVEDAEAVADMFGVSGGGMEFPTGLYLRLPLRVGSASVSIEEVKELGSGDIILLDGFVPKLEMDASL